MIQNIQEALPLSLAKRYVGISDKKWKTLYPQLFTTGEDRLYFPFEQTLNLSASPVYNQIKHILNNNEYEIEDYRAGYATKGGQKYKIGKVLKGLGEDDYLRQFNSDPVRSNKKYEIVISRHPYDLAGMSTDRAWKSCMNLDPETAGHISIARQYIPAAIKGGSLVSYLIGANDHNINKPFARVTIKPFKEITKKRKNVYPYLKASERVYGLDEYKNKLQKQTQAILDTTYNNQITDIVNKSYKYNDKLYFDNGDVQVVGKQPNYIMGTYSQIVVENKKIARFKDGNTNLIGFAWVAIKYREGNYITDIPEKDIIFAPKFLDTSSATFFNNGLYAWYSKEDRSKYGMLQVYPTAKFLTDDIYQSIHLWGASETDNKLRVFVQNEDGGCGVLNEQLKVIIPLKYKDVKIITLKPKSVGLGKFKLKLGKSRNVFSCDIDISRRDIYTLDGLLIRKSIPRR